MSLFRKIRTREVWRTVGKRWLRLRFLNYIFIYIYIYILNIYIYTIQSVRTGPIDLSDSSINIY